MRQSLRIAIVWAVCAACAPHVQPQESKRLAALVDALHQRLNRTDAKMSELSERVLVLQSVRCGAAPLTTPQLMPISAPASLAPAPGAPRVSPVSVFDDDDEEGAGLSEARQSLVLSRGSDLFHRALKAYQEGKAARAFDDFASFVRTYPSHPDADSALYWMGQCKFDAEAYRDAIEQYTTLANQYPRSSKAAEALFKAAVAYEKLQQGERARAMFARLIAAYPQSASAELARSREHVSGDVHAP